ncbi:MAG: crosslink repair DNA glycosylase YcaQ family protein, partial [Steroidobacteraceae bacterium]
DRPRLSGDPTAADLMRSIRMLGLLQMDSVNVLVRAHYLPLYSRIGPYARELLERAAYHPSQRTLFEYWAHEASLLPLETHPLLRWRMERARAGIGTWNRIGRFLRDHAAFVREVLGQLRERGPLGAGELQQPSKSKKGWWEWSEAKTALECLFWTGEVTTATRRHFERIYDLTERVLPAQILQQPTPAPADAQRSLMEVAARALGIATESDLRDYFRLDLRDARERLRELVEAGRLQAITVEGWRQPGYLHLDARVPQTIAAGTLLSPFDPLVWERKRAERLFDFRYRLEIYTPAHKRVHGYYVLPFLLNAAVVARVDLKADRKSGTLRVLAAHLEAGHEVERVALALAGELRTLAPWLGLQTIMVGRRGKLTAALRTALRA